jgi:hypothetical protein
MREFRREVLAAVDKAEGRMAREVLDVEKRLSTRTETRAMAEISAQLTVSERSRLDTEAKAAEVKRQADADAEAWGRLRKLLIRAVVGASTFAGIALAAFVDRSCASREIATEAKAVAAEVVDAKAAELTSGHEQTKAQAESNSKRIDKLEDKLDKVLELLQPPEPEAAPPAAAKGKGHK